ncbi:hypothetical protein NDU88_000427, partial [Pleurodeles waltl]
HNPLCGFHGRVWVELQVEGDPLCEAKPLCTLITPHCSTCTPLCESVVGAPDWTQPHVRGITTQ